MVDTTWTQTAGMTSETGTDNIEDYAEQAEASKDAAAASETAAASSASAAAGSATAAQTAKTAAELAETNAETAETNAANSATTAASQASIATTKASEASASESAAAASASAAAASEAGVDADRVAAQAAASAAATSQTNAATSATNASTSETNAANSATASASSATASANSASAASASETAAATSETNAATSETNAAASETNAATSAAASASSATAAASSASSASSSATSASNAQTAAESARDATLAAYDNFDDRYLGTKASDPTVDNDGNPLVAGSIYFNSVSGAMRVYTGSAWVAAYVNGADYLALSGGTMTGDVGHGDNVKATFGASADLQIYHTGGSSYIEDAGTGNLILKTNGADIRMIDGSSNELLSAVNGGRVKLGYGSLGGKLETTSAGINVTGTAESDAVVVGGGSGVPALHVTTARNAADTSDIALIGNSVLAGQTSLSLVSEGALAFRTGSSDYTGGKDTSKRAMEIYSSGDINFYEDTGTTGKLTWDASDEALEFDDNVKATFGASADLQVYHDGSNSYIKDAGTGFLNIGGYDSVKITNPDGTNVGAVFNTAAAVDLNYNGSTKLATTSSGINVTGTVVADKIRVESIESESLGVSSSLNFNDDTDPFGGVQTNFTTLSSIGGLNIIYDANDNDSNGFLIGQNNIDTSVATKHFNINGNGDINFYEDTGTSAKLMWDASAEELQLASGVALELNGWTITESGGSLYFATGGTNKMKLDASGNLDVVGSVNSNATIS